jgi:hypothetical protein
VEGKVNEAQQGATEDGGDLLADWPSDGESDRRARASGDNYIRDKDSQYYGEQISGSLCKATVEVSDVQ